MRSWIIGLLIWTIILATIDASKLWWMVLIFIGTVAYALLVPDRYHLLPAPEYKD